MKIIILFLPFLTLFGPINGYQKEDLKLLYVVTDNSFVDPSSLSNPNNYTDDNFNKNPEILSLLKITAFNDIRRLSMFIKNYYNSTDIEVEYRKDDIMSLLTGIILYEALQNTETSYKSWQKLLNDKWNQETGRVTYVYKSQSCDDVHLRNHSGIEGLLFLQNFIHLAKSIKDNKMTYNVNKILSANFVIVEELIQRFNFSEVDNNNRPSRSLMFELVYSVATNVYEIQVAFYPGFNNNSKSSPEYFNFSESKHNVTIEEFEQMLNFNSQLNSCNKQISEPKYEPVVQQSISLNSTNEANSTLNTLSFSDNNYIKNQTNLARNFDKDFERSNNNEESSKNGTGEFENDGINSPTSSNLVHLSPDELIGEANYGRNFERIVQEHEEDFNTKLNKSLTFVVQSSILVEDDKYNSDGNKAISSLLLNIILITEVMLVWH